MDAGGTGADGGERRAAVIYNPTKKGVEALRRDVASAIEEAGWAEPVWIETEADDPGKGMAEIAVAKGVDLVIAAGGDGTVRAVAEGLRGTGVEMAAVPLGTGNLLARTLGIPVNDVKGALQTALHGVPRAIDVIMLEVTRPGGEAETFASLVMAGIGIDADMIAKTSDDLKKRVGWLAYVEGAVRALPESEPFRVYYRLDDDHAHRARVSSVLIANLGDLPGNVELIPDAEVDDGRLDVAVLQPKGFLGWLQVWRRVTWENRVLRRTAVGRTVIKMRDDTEGSERSSVIAYLRGRSFSLDLGDDAKELEVDGDEFGKVVKIAAKTDASSVVIRVDREHLG
ncbi:diacylglycerol/lipid kinase family protein [Agromyces rhizosphaerae]|uniref:diacylglycerol/lipid kinase family protein n=1 Tax=Agromyces rhizosphaerae TaxID=88374 RepID=UPI002491A850|nr:diacylglycerol kinase family protein [Agromyces rhizosphaerae]